MNVLGKILENVLNLTQFMLILHGLGLFENEITHETRVIFA